MPKNKKRILFVGESVTLSHVGRILSLSSRVTDYDVFHAFDERYRALTPKEIQYSNLPSISPDLFTKRVNNYEFPYKFEELLKYVEDDLLLIDQIQPDLLIGDFRITLAISSKLKKVPYCSVTNSYWLPSHKAPQNPPDHFILRPFPTPARKFLFQLFAPYIYALSSASFNKVAKHFGCTEATGSLLEVYTQSDHTFLVEPLGWTLEGDSEKYSHVGPVKWTPQNVAPPGWLNELEIEDPCILISVGTSGSQTIIEKSLEALKDFEGKIIIAGASEEKRYFLGKSEVFQERFVSIGQVLPKCRLFISNGGSLSMVDALSVGVPIIGIASNYDQYLNASLIEKNGVGSAFFDRKVNSKDLSRAIYRWLLAALQWLFKLVVIR